MITIIINVFGIFIVQKLQQNMIRECKNTKLDPVPASRATQSSTTENFFGDEIFHPGSKRIHDNAARTHTYRYIVIILHTEN